ncbi:MAG: 3-methyl-2-oxobutanoate hydroxymethyltransferase [Desulfuromonadaceae bacterium]|nr:3-methyl-2-oxobutanoate hydroxymethyltransferase [Desulfuromonadaceae bacterium]
MKKWNVNSIKATKGKQKLACITAYEAHGAKLADRAGMQILLVGDSVGMTMLGHTSTLPVTMEDMLRHTAAVTRSVVDAMVVADMPFLSYQISLSEAIRNAGRFMQETQADAVKIEGGVLRAATVQALTDNGIPVLGHIGLTPQSIKVLGGYKVHGRTREACQALIDDAEALVAAGAFALVLECTPPEIGAAITAAVPVPVISVGAGPACDGQMVVMHDMLGLTPKPAKFVKEYANLSQTVADAFASYVSEVEAGLFPAAEHCYSNPPPPMANK